MPHLSDENVLALAQPIQLDEGAEVHAVLVADLPEGLAGGDLRRSAEGGGRVRRGDGGRLEPRAPTFVANRCTWVGAGAGRAVCVLPLSRLSTLVMGVSLMTFVGVTTGGGAATMGFSGAFGIGAGGGGGAGALLPVAVTAVCGAASPTGMTSFSFT